MTSSIEVYVSSNLNSFPTLRRFPVGLTILSLKEKLELVTGASAETMIIQLQDKEKEVVIESLDENSKTLMDYSVQNEMILHVIDPSHKLGEYEDVSSVQKFELSDDSYSARQDTFRAFKAKHVPISDDKNNMQQKLELEQKQAEGISIGNRCEVRVKSQPKRRGTVKYIGEIEQKAGIWIGIEYDEPVGKNDGSVQGKHYFDCQPKYGGFVKPQDVFVGEFPEECDEL